MTNNARETMREKIGSGRRNPGVDRPLRRQAPPEMGAKAFRAAAHALVDEVADFLASVRSRPLTTAESPAAIRAAIEADSPLPVAGADLVPLLRTAARTLFDHSLFNAHPRFFGYITSSPAPIGMLGDLLAAAVNANVSAWRLSPVATEVEAQTLRWLAELVGYPLPSGGILVSGGNMANMVGLFAARAAKADWDLRRTGLRDPAGRPLRVYASEETHTWIQKAADLSGLGTDAIRWIPTDDRLAMRVAELRAAIERDRETGDRPMMVVGTAGSVSTGAVDPLADIAAVCRATDVWFHVDGAYGALAAGVSGASPELRSLALADSVALDPHKWLYAPIEAGCTLVRNPDTLRRAFAYHPPYYHFGQEATDYVDLGPQNSRGFRALKVWLALRHIGLDGYRRLIAEDMALSRHLHALVSGHRELEAVTQELSINTFRYVPLDLRASAASRDAAAYLNTLNEDLLERIQNSGRAFVSNAVVRGRYLLRACIVNFNTTAADVEALPDIVAALGRQADAALRPGNAAQAAQPGAAGAPA